MHDDVETSLEEGEVDCRTLANHSAVFVVRAFALFCPLSLHKLTSAGKTRN